MLLTDRGLRLEIWGESHGEAIGMKLSGVKAGESIDLELLQGYVDRRKSRAAVYSTARAEPDKIIITKGIAGGVTTGETIEAEIKNTNQRSSDYSEIRYTPRPSHADYPALVKFGDIDMSGGGKFSGRLTAPLCIAGGIAVQILERKGVTVGAYIGEVFGIKGGSYKDREIKKEDLLRLKTEDFPVLDKSRGEEMLKAIQDARKDADSVGGVVEAVALGVPAGLGDALFESMESKLSALLFSIPAVKAVEFGGGFDITHLRGSAANDEYYYDENGEVKTYTNNNGGILGGITNGMPITCRVAFKPTPSIGKRQRTIDLQKKENTVIEINGRHDACIVPRAAVVVESCLALAILDSI